LVPPLVAAFDLLSAQPLPMTEILDFKNSKFNKNR